MKYNLPKFLTDLFSPNIRVANLLLIATVSLLFYVYNYHLYITEPPQSVHAWRQTDCATQALNYAEHDANFFKPQIHCQVSEKFRSGYCMEEFPIVYYFISILYRLFGNMDLMFRMTILCSFFAGLYYLFKLYHRLTADIFWSYSLTVLYFTAPVLVFYANNYVLNITALAVTIFAWVHFFAYVSSKKQVSLIISISLFTLAALLKISELISLCTILGILFLDYFSLVKFDDNGKLFTKPIPLVLLISGALASVFGWYYYSHHYNALYGQTYYLYTTGDIFSLSAIDREQIQNIISEYWSYYYQNRIALYFFCIITIANISFYRKANALLLSITAIILFGSILFSVLFFKFFRDHDYYVISLYILTIFSTATFIEMANRNWKKLSQSVYVKVLFICFLGYSISYAHKKIKARYESWENSDRLGPLADMYSIAPYLDELGISKNAKVISIPDNTPNLTLYLINRHGWTNFINQNNQALIELGIKSGAEYIIISAPALLNDLTIQPYLTNKIGQYGTVGVYKVSEN